MARGPAGGRTKDDLASAAWLFEDSHDLYLQIDARGRISHANRACEPMLGWTAQALRGRPFEGLIHPEDRQIDLNAGNPLRLRTVAAKPISPPALIAAIVSAFSDEGPAAEAGASQAPSL